jgi:hypothetical protein
VRRIFLIVLGSAILVSACGSSTATSAPATQAPVATPTAALAATDTPVVVPSLAPSNAALDGDWITFAPDGTGFTAKFPGAPTLTTQTQTTAVGDAAVSLWAFEQGGNLVYDVMVTKYPTGSLAAAKLSALYDGAINGMTGGEANLTVAGQEDMALGGHDGRTFLLTSATGSVKGGVWIVGDNMYMAYVAFTSSVDPGLIDTFLSDFALTV